MRQTDRQTRRSRQGELCWVLKLNTHMHKAESVEQECHPEARRVQQRPAEA